MGNNPTLNQPHLLPLEPCSRHTMPPSHAACGTITKLVMLCGNAYSTLAIAVHAQSDRTPSVNMLATVRSNYHVRHHYCRYNAPANANFAESKVFPRTYHHENSGQNVKCDIDAGGPFRQKVEANVVMATVTIGNHGSACLDVLLNKGRSSWRGIHGVMVRDQLFMASMDRERPYFCWACL